ncbi:hypothetical protein MJH54_28800, partial [Salmonella enterica subsp. enterica serovar Montevideo]|nr:hypothetical protein [Salmonella enterica subsp. enterica serovar Montevideo]
NIQQGYQNHGIGESGSASLEYDGAKGNANIGYNVSDNGDYQHTFCSIETPSSAVSTRRRHWI